MTLAAKMNVKPGMSVAVLHAPADVTLDLGEPADAAGADVVVVFVADRKGLEEVQQLVVDAASADRLTWIAYPKGGKLGTDLNRDSLWELLAKTGIRPVRQVSIDDTWSALRFRPA